MEDIVLVTAESVRRDFVEEMDFISSHDVLTGVTAAHYTRPSLASLLSSSYHAAIRTQIEHPTVAEVLSNFGYTCIGLHTSPQADGSFGFDAGFGTYKTHVNPRGRGTILEDIVHSFDILGRLFYRLHSRQDRRASAPRDLEIVQKAIRIFNRSDPPRFLWVHLMESHFPYGRGTDAISPNLNRKALFSPESITKSEHEQITLAYRRSLGHVDGLVEELLEGLDGDPLVAFAGDHGELFGEDGVYFHPPERKIVRDELVEVPVIFNRVSIEPGSHPISLLDIVPTLLSATEIDVPESWHGVDLTTGNRPYTITVAPWKDSATIAYRTENLRILARDANVEISADDATTTAEETEMPDHIRDHLRDLGYVSR